MTQTLVESCVDIEVAHLSILMVWSPTLYGQMDNFKAKCKQIKNSNSPYVSDVISLIIHEKLRLYAQAAFE